jgi:hypothetical protein
MWVTILTDTTHVSHVIDWHCSCESWNWLTLLMWITILTDTTYVSHAIDWHYSCESRYWLTLLMWVTTLYQVYIYAVSLSNRANSANTLSHYYSNMSHENESAHFKLYELLSNLSSPKRLNFFQGPLLEGPKRHMDRFFF